MTLSPEQQEELFALVRKHFPDWNVRKRSGYVHGVLDGAKRDAPKGEYIRGSKKTPPKPYAIGYLYGFLDMAGVDALMQDWVKELGWTAHSISFRWWEHAEP